MKRLIRYNRKSGKQQPVGRVVRPGEPITPVKKPVPVVTP
jgi:hypothetical protein